MWTPDDVAIRVEELDGDTLAVRIDTPAGAIEVYCTASFEGTILHLSGVHIDGLARGLLRRHGLNAIGRKVLETFNVTDILVEGASRSTGANRGRRPRPIRFPRRG